MDKPWPNLPRLALFSGVLLVFLGVSLGYFQYTSYTKDLQVRQGAIDRNLALMELRTDAYLERLVLDAEFIAHAPVLRNYLQHPSTETRTLAQEGLMTLSVLRNDYDQVRYIDARGMEHIRVDNRSGTVRFADQLQDKSDRDYVQDGLVLKRREANISDIDLNIENGRIEQPYQSMIRVVVGVNVDGRQNGLIVLNARAQELIRRLQMVLPTPDEQLVVLNNDGGWIAGGGDQNWQFALDSGARLAAQAPELWKKIKANPAGQFDYQGQCHHYRWYDFDVVQGHSPRLLIALRDQARNCNYLSNQAMYAWLMQLLFASVSTLPLLWLWHFSRIRERTLQTSLQESNKQLELVTHEADLGLIMVDHQCLVRWINPEAQRMLGWNASELIGQNLHRKVHLTPQGVSLHSGICPTLLALETGKRYRNDNDRMLDRSGNRLQVSVRVSPYGSGEERKAIVTIADISNYVTREKLLTQLATTDELTGTLNRRSVLQHLQAFLDNPLAQPCVLMLDIDFFKRVNDTYGHNAGDRVLITVTDTVRNLLRKGDLLGRLGGEEFVIVQENNDPHGAQALAERLREAIAESRCLTDDGTPIAVTASFGIAHFNNDESLEQLLNRADEALYRAKNNGRNRVETA